VILFGSGLNSGPDPRHLQLLSTRSYWRLPSLGGGRGRSADEAAGHLLAGIVSVAALAAPPQRRKSLRASSSAVRFVLALRPPVLSQELGRRRRAHRICLERPLSLEVTADFTKTVDTASAQNVSVSGVGANLVLNSHERQGDAHATVGSRDSSSARPPYNSPNMINGARARVFLSQHVALRLDARALYNRQNRDPLNPTPRGSWTGQVQEERALIFLHSTQQAAASAGSINGMGRAGRCFPPRRTRNPRLRPHRRRPLLITARRTALYVAYEQAIFLSDAHAVIFDPASSNHRPARVSATSRSRTCAG